MEVPFFDPTPLKSTFGSKNPFSGVKMDPEAENQD